ncbi:DUF2599 domain-containing protein [Nocardia niigatensis]|uniref:DUF2599 domain-containing protein n=1 Tax=Nocardia niigatensis TaxID=209249 RepID=UPI000314C539|nr:DUF2599 domain-containing protein [Nocardia niigatensis]
MNNIHPSPYRSGTSGAGAEIAGPARRRVARSLRWARGALVFASAIAIAVAGAAVTTPTAHADAQYPVAWTKIGIYPQSAPSMGSGQVGKALPDGAKVTIVCEGIGQPVSNGDKTIDVWERLDTGAWLPNAFIKTDHDGWTPGIPNCKDYVPQHAHGAQDPHADPKVVEQKTKLPCSSFIATAQWIPRANGVQSLHVIPTACGYDKATIDKQAAFDELYRYMHANWSGDLYWSLRNQFDCHADYAPKINKHEWNLENNVPNLGYWGTLATGCGDVFNFFR